MSASKVWAVIAFAVSVVAGVTVTVVTSGQEETSRIRACVDAGGQWVNSRDLGVSYECRR